MFSTCTHAIGGAEVLADGLGVVHLHGLAQDAHHYLVLKVLLLGRSVHYQRSHCLRLLHLCLVDVLDVALADDKVGIDRLVITLHRRQSSQILATIL